ncbi:hypothetical protein GGI15_002522 [Coemansia interrupta]|uniref:Major facilitator superfamily (MFS) profile domain-containing protein n=1 Tax=Coemansia interrupta TaxID=1126814 RepID=A0A9W8HK36_9FUNG|nr:hypothetical protein GGI15_002522 [Coemansia interrupta]
MSADASPKGSQPPPSSSLGKRISRIVFIALLLDILSFTIILPLLPRSLEAYKLREGSDSTTLLGWTLANVSHLRELILTKAGPRASHFLEQGARADLVLLGGLLGSVYSLLQCIVAPIIGRAADRFGRRRTLMLCMAGNIVWTVLWVFSYSFESFLVARIIAGLSEGNVQLSTTIIADVTDPQTRSHGMALVGIASHGMALVGIAFAVGFTLGPSIGAYFSRLSLESASSSGVLGYAPFATAAVFSLALLLTESVYLYVKLPETLDFGKTKAAAAAAAARQIPESSDTLVEQETEDTMDASEKHAQQKLQNQQNLSAKRILRRLNYIHFGYLFFFSGMEYTLTFLTHDKFNFSNAQQGKLLGFIGIVSTLLQGGYVRRVKGKSAHRDKSLVAQGMAGCAVGLLSIAMCCINADSKGEAAGQPSWWLWAGALGFAVASATVVNCLNSMVSLVGAAADGSASSTGRKLGDFRSAGQIGRALGPMFACSLYWLSGAASCYIVGTAAVAVITLTFVASIPATPEIDSKKKIC